MELLQELTISINEEPLMDADAAAPVTVVSLSGRLDRDAAHGPLQEKVDALLAQGKTNLVVDMSGVENISSVALGMLANLHRTLGERNGCLVIRTPSKRVMDVLRTTRLATVMHIGWTRGETHTFFH